MVPNTWLSGFLILVQLLGKYMIIGHLDPEGKPETLARFSPLNPQMNWHSVPHSPILVARASTRCVGSS